MTSVDKLQQVRYKQKCVCVLRASMVSRKENGKLHSASTDPLLKLPLLRASKCITKVTHPLSKTLLCFIFVVVRNFGNLIITVIEKRTSAKLVLRNYQQANDLTLESFKRKSLPPNVIHYIILTILDVQMHVRKQYTRLDMYCSIMIMINSVAGTTLFGPIITVAANIANQSMATNEHKYFFLLIITAGVIKDLEETKDAIVQASDLLL
ncbi:hypothetical protein L2E82_37422 [Cichorium intybus]|uniref:Uncharacterized protein n=1 Tax=Cichorium intybus TaxID=13427 RepID=A0ACB9ADP0_CICIN|nr:hypothetical protein L2E82_37422 [Cichorium intybus]